MNNDFPQMTQIHADNDRTLAISLRSRICVHLRDLWITINRG
jgi:hypothetical protein